MDVNDKETEINIFNNRIGERDTSWGNSWGFADVAEENWLLRQSLFLRA